MKNLLKNIGKKSKNALSIQLDTKTKNKVLNDYCHLIKINTKLILTENTKDVNNARKKNKALEFLEELGNPYRKIFCRDFS